MHDFKFQRFALLVHRNNSDILYLVEGRYYDADNKNAPIYMMTPSTTDCMCSYSADYVEHSFTEYVKEEERQFQ